MPGRQRPADGRIEPLDRRRADMETGGGSIGHCLRCGVDHRVGQSADRCDHRDAAVAQRIQLVQSTRFVLRRHQKQIARRLDPVRQPLVKPDVHAAPGRKHLGQSPQRRLVVGITAAQHRPLHRPAVDQVLPHHRHDQIPTFLRSQPSDQSDQRHVRVGRDVHFELQRPLVGRFARSPRLSIVIDRQMRIGRRVPQCRIDPVDDAG